MITTRHDMADVAGLDDLEGRRGLNPPRDVRCHRTRPLMSAPIGRSIS